MKSVILLPEGQLFASEHSVDLSAIFSAFSLVEEMLQVSVTVQ